MWKMVAAYLLCWLYDSVIDTAKVCWRKVSYKTEILICRHVVVVLPPCVLFYLATACFVSGPGGQGTIGFYLPILSIKWLFSCSFLSPVFLLVRLLILDCVWIQLCVTCPDILPVLVSDIAYVLHCFYIIDQLLSAQVHLIAATCHTHQ